MDTSLPLNTCRKRNAARNARRKESREKRHKRVLRLVGLQNTTDSALCSILKEEGCEALSRKQILSSLEKEWKILGTTLELPLQDGASYQWELARIDLLFVYFCTTCIAFRDLMCETVRRCGSQLSLVLYGDEVTPGNPLKPDNSRKYNAMYISVFEFGPVALMNDQFWLPLASLRSQICHAVSGSLSSVLRLLLRSIFAPPLDLHTSGMMLRLPEPNVVVFRLGRVIADADELRGMFSLKGTAGIRPCPCCRNVLKKGHAAAMKRGQKYLVDITCTEFDKFDLCEDADYAVGQALLTASKDTVTAKKFKAMEKSLGQVHNDKSVFADDWLNDHVVEPTSLITLDWMHIFFVGGLYNHLARTFLRACRKKLGFRFKHIRTFVKAAWETPRYMHDRAYILGVFTDARERAMDRAAGLRGSASELLTTMPLIRRFVETLVIGRKGGVLDSLAACWLCLCTLIDTIVACKRHMYSSVEAGAAAMREASEKFMEVFVLMGETPVKPKFHLLWHLWLQYLRDECVLDTFPGERKHKGTKRYAQTCTSLHRFDRNIILRAILDQRRHLQTKQCNVGLKGTTEELKCGGRTLRRSRQLYFHGMTVTRGDVLAQSGDWILVEDCLECDGNVAISCTCLVVVCIESPTCTKLKRNGDPCVMPLGDCGKLHFPHAWTLDGDHVLVLHWRG